MKATKQNYRLAGAAITVMTSMVLSRATGFLRSTLIPNMLSKNDSDALFAAFSITNFMYFLLVGGSIAAALIPVLSGYIARRQEQEGWKAVSSFINCVVILMVLFSIAGIIFSRQLVDLTATKLNAEAKRTAVQVTRIMFPSVCFIMLAGFTNGVLNSYKRFAAAAFGPSVYNIGTVLSILLFNKYGVDKIALGIMGSSLFYFLFQFQFAFKNFRHYRPVILFRNAGFRRLVRLAVPSLAASSIMPLNVLISQRFASYFPGGSLTAYSNSTDIWQLPYGIFAMGLGTAILPSLSENYALEDNDEYCRVLEKALRSVLFLVVPSMAAFLAIPQHVVSVIYKWSPLFDSTRLAVTANLLAWFTPAMLAQSLLAILNRAFYARNDVFTPVITGVASMLVNIASCLLLVGKFRNVFGLGSVAFSYSLQSVVCAAVLIVILSKKDRLFRPNRLVPYLARVSLASAIMGVLIFILSRMIPVDFAEIFSLAGKIREAAVMAIFVAVGVALYFTAAIVLGVEEAVNLLGILRKKLLRLRNDSLPEN